MSAHERHLLAFIDIWPKIRAAVPDATLELFYGYDEWKRMPTNAAFAEHIRYFDRKRPMLETMGITFHPGFRRKRSPRRCLELRCGSTRRTGPSVGQRWLRRP